MLNRRNFLKLSTGAYLASSLPLSQAKSATPCHRSQADKIHPDHFKLIPGTSQALPSVGMGTWITFDVPDVANQRISRSKVLHQFFDYGGAMIDSSPMYGYAEEVLGYSLDRTEADCELFAASKIWTPISAQGPAQMNQSETLWNVDKMDLMYVHNLLNWKNHLPRLQKWKSEGRLRYVGISTSHGRRHEQLEQLIKTQSLDFVQLTYNYDQRETEKRLIPLAQDHGIAIVVNRPFQRGRLVDKYDQRPLPGLARELGCNSWAQYLLLYVVSHPAVTVAIPATSRQDHMIENMSVMRLPLPDSNTRQKM